MTTYRAEQDEKLIDRIGKLLAEELVRVGNTFQQAPGPEEA